MKQMMDMQANFMQSVGKEIQEVKSIALARSRSVSPERRAPSANADPRIASEGAGGVTRGPPAGTTSEVLYSPPRNAQLFEIGTPPTAAGGASSSAAWRGAPHTTGFGSTSGQISVERSFSVPRATITPNVFADRSSAASHEIAGATQFANTPQFAGV